MRCASVLALPVLVSLALAAGTASASPEDIFGYGAKSPAMGATGPASATGFEAAYANPALLSGLRHKKLTLGLQGATFHLYARGDDLPGRVSVEPAKGAVIGADVPLPFGGVLHDRIGAALAFYTPTDIIVRGRLLYPEKPQFPLFPDRTQSLAVRMGVGADLGHGVRVGGGFAALAEIVGTVLVATDATGRVGTRVEDQLVATYAPIVGVTYDLPIREKIRVGVTYRGTLDARFAVSIDATKLSTLNIPVFNIAGLAQYDPAQIAFEVAHVTRSRTVALGLTYKRWSAYPGPLEPTILCPPESPDCGALQPPKIGYSDTIALHAGVDRAIPMSPSVTAHARGGVFFEGDPLPSRLESSDAFDPATRTNVEVPTRYFNGSRLAFTLGGGLELAKPLPPIELDFFCQYHVIIPSETQSVSASTGAVLSDAKVTGYALAGGMLLGVKF